MPVGFASVKGPSSKAASSSASTSRGRQPTTSSHPGLERRPSSAGGHSQRPASPGLLKPTSSNDAKLRTRSQEPNNIPRSASRSSTPLIRPGDLNNELAAGRKTSKRSSVSPRARSPGRKGMNASKASRMMRKQSFDSDDDDGSPTRRDSLSPSRGNYTLDRNTSYDRRRPSYKDTSPSPQRNSPIIPVHTSQGVPPITYGSSLPIPSSASPSTLSSTTQRPSTPVKYKPQSKRMAEDGQVHSPAASPAPDLAAPTREKSSSSQKAGGLLSKVPQTLVAFQGLKVLNEHAQIAKEWAEWLNDVHGAPEEMQSLSAKAATARDTINQIQQTLEKRPDLVEGESGEALKEQIEESIKSANVSFIKMTKMLEDLSKRGPEDATVLKSLKEFYDSYKYRDEWEDKVKAADEDVQKELGNLSTLMVNIYSRSLMKPASAPAAAAVPPPTPISPGNIDSSSRQPPPREPSPQKTPEEGRARFNSPDDEGLPVPKGGGPAPLPTRKAASPHKPVPEDVEQPMKRPPSPSELDSEEAMIGGSPLSTTPEQPPRPTKQDKIHPPPPGGGGILPIDPVSGKPTPSPPTVTEDPDEALLDAAWSGNLDAVARALRRSNPNTRDFKGLTPLHLAAERDHLAVAILLLDRGADADARANGSRTPLHLASKYATADMVELLLERGKADPDAVTADGQTPLHYAVSVAADGDEERREVVRVLRDWGANPRIENKRGRTPRDVAQKRDFWDIASTLRRAEKKWDDDHHQNWLQRHGFMK